MTNERKDWLDALRLVAGLSMVGLHASSDARGQPYPDAEISEKILPLFIRTVLYTARTELFILISAFLLILALQNRPRSYGATIKQQGRRLLLPFLFWSIFYAFWSLLKAQHFGYLPSMLDNISTPAVWAEYMLLGTSKYHMHFLPTLFAILLFYPLFRYSVNRSWLGLTIIAALAFKREADIYLWSDQQNNPAFPYLLQSVKILSYVGYGMIAGSFLGLCQKYTERDYPRWLLPSVLILGGCFFSIKIWHMNLVLETGTWARGYAITFWADFLMPAILFLVVMLVPKLFHHPFLSKIAPMSFGIYLCHPLFLDLAEIHNRRYILSPSQSFLIEAMFALIATSLFVLALSRINSLAWTVGLGPFPKFHTRKIWPASSEKIHV